MGERTAIGWTDHTFNPWWGCARVSPACNHCYAETFAKRVGQGDLWGKTGERRFFGDKHWSEPVRWNARAEEARRPALVFCASMADVFEDRRDLDEHRQRLFELIEATPWLRWQLLTKRPETVLDLVPDQWKRSTEFYAAGFGTVEHPSRWPSNCWLGTTVEDQQRAEERIPLLLATPAPVRFLSCEPLLGPVDISPWLATTIAPSAPIHWVIIGGESGPGHRPLSHFDARVLALQARNARIPVFFKQDSGPRPGTPGPDDLEGNKQFPPEATQ